MTDRTSLDLSGQWTVRLDPDRNGLDEEWFDQSINDQFVHLPGALRESNVGEEVGPDTDWIGGAGEDLAASRYEPYRSDDSFKMPHWLQPERHYVGVAWYERTASIPEKWLDRRILLSLERPHWHTTLWVNGSRIGTHDSLSVPHEYDLTDAVSQGENRLTVRIDNSLEPTDVGENAHSVSDHTQTAWHGAIGDLMLQTTSRVWIDNLQVHPDAENQAARVALRIGTHHEEPSTATINLDVTHEEVSLVNEQQDITIPTEGLEIETTLDLGQDVPLWDAFDPSLCRLSATIDTSTTYDQDEVTFGVRNVGTDGSQVTINDRPTTLRGTLECCIFPETGYPPMDIEEWRDVFRTITDHGLNHIRFHSWCPPEVVFEAADEIGIYLQVECSSWANQSTSLGEERPVDDWLYEEGERVLEAYGNHPSFTLFAYGNEPSGNDAEYLSEWVDTFKQRTDRQLVTGGSGWPTINENEFHVTPHPRIHAWGDGLDDRVNAEQPTTTTDYRKFIEKHPDIPTIAHETGQWCAYPNLEEIEKYTGALDAKNFEIFRDFLVEAGMRDQANEFLLASGHLQELCYKEEIESALRTPGMGGFQLLQLHDFPGQGTALVGMLDAFFDAKPYHDTEQFGTYAGPIVPLARLDKRVFTTSEDLTAHIELSQFGPRDLPDATVDWTLIADNDRVFREGTFEPGTLSTGALHHIGEVRASLAEVDTPGKLTLAVSVVGTNASNSWDLWVYPRNIDTTTGSDITTATAFDEEVHRRLRDGEAVVLLSNPEDVVTDVELGFTSIFWNTAWTDNQPPHTLGITCDPDHPALQEFPTSNHTDWQWWDPITNGATMELGAFPDELRPIVQVVPDWFDPQKLGLVFEARVLEGRLLLSSIDLTNDLGDRPVARQLRQSLLEYARSDEFDPEITVSPQRIWDLFE